MNRAVGIGIKGSKKEKEGEKIVLHKKIPQDSSPGVGSEIEKTPLRHPLLLQAEINEGGRRTNMKVEVR